MSNFLSAPIIPAVIKNPPITPLIIVPMLSILMLSMLMLSIIVPDPGRCMATGKEAPISFRLSPANIKVTASEIIFATWDTLEADKLATFWLIERFISPGALFQIHPKGSSIKQGICFDTPFSRFGRNFKECVYETMRKAYEVNDPIVIRIGQAIHQLEISRWESPSNPLSMKIDVSVKRIIYSESENSKNSDSINDFESANDRQSSSHNPIVRKIKYGIRIFDEIYTELKLKPETQTPLNKKNHFRSQ
ncbi:MAG: hypothetical protein CVV64_10300 [Candidatus Wallbacteria bacterium HGW-Wallbacteria-1]|jgi:hypothetical protein|uniref:ChrB C-terminal domain-containing protein n=1 Tax=Candidatus Wallbacteria bacterium HGW-Wallbacteria-1 TaxID=2013854 RepID=A0A2N1PPT2_9BACT|nr:MAG: hypothetical protein CVV64_10300 [Candidatus Wallbacteria bacterium HGW-Wallbacteria-1]